MANWCVNRLSFSGDKDKIKEAIECFKQIREINLELDRGALPYFISDDEVKGDWFFDTVIDESQEDFPQVTYNTKWSPNHNEVETITKHFGIEISNDYEELGMGVFGKAVYDTDGYSDVYLTEEDFKQYTQDEETDLYTFRGKEWDSEYEILDTLLEEKLAK